MGLFDAISSLWKPFVGDDSSSFSKEGCDDTAIAAVERDTGTKREEADVETETAVKEPIRETELTDGMVGEEADAESHADDEDTRDDVEVAADTIEEAESEDETVGPEPKSEFKAEVEVEIDGGSEVRGEPELGDKDEESDGVEVEDEESDDETVDNADASTVDRTRDTGPAYVECLSGIGIGTIADLVMADVDEVGDEIDVSPKRAQRWIDRAGDA